MRDYTKKWKRVYISRGVYLPCEPSIKFVRVSDLFTTAKRYFDEEDWRLVNRYAQAMRRGDRFPLIDIGKRGRKGNFNVHDGNHRAEACRKLGRKQIPALFWFKQY
jgi:hypothetical protein